MTDSVKWLSYNFNVYQMEGEWYAVGGVYIFTGVKNGTWQAYYVGVADSFKDRLPNHERWAEAVRLGATHVHALVESLEASRLAVEKALIGAYQPPLNTQHR